MSNIMTDIERWPEDMRGLDGSRAREAAVRAQRQKEFDDEVRRTIGSPGVFPLVFAVFMVAAVVVTIVAKAVIQ